MQNIFVGNLSATTTEQGLRTLFEPFGQVLSVRIVTDRDSAGPRGFAFVEMSDDAEAGQAISATNGTLLDEHLLQVNEARPKDEQTPSINNNMRRHRDHRF